MLANASICFDMSAFKPVYASPETSAQLSGNSTSPASSLEGSPVDARVAQRRAEMAEKKRKMDEMKARQTFNSTILLTYSSAVPKRMREEVLLSDGEADAADKANAKAAAKPKRRKLD